MTCSHNAINIYPTLENSWNIADTFKVECHICKVIIFDDTPLDNIKKYVKTHKCIINLGSKYLPIF